MATRYPGVTFIKINVDEAPELSQSLCVSAMPTFVFFKSGKEITRFSGADVAKLEHVVKQHASVAFEGAGHTLGAARPAAAAPVPPPVAAAAAAGKAVITVDAAQPTGRVMLQLPNGDRRPVTVNPERHTVADLFAEAAAAAGSARVDLQVREVPAGMRRLESTATTLKEAKCVGAVVIVNTL
jgi:thioredoxin-like negative regulator of GroEL